MGAIVISWILVMTFACGLRIAFSATPLDADRSALLTILPYVLVILVPVAALLLALKVFPADGLLAQPEIRLARYGKWRELNCLDASSHPLFGTTGMMASLVIGMLINVPFRSIEFLLGPDHDEQPLCHRLCHGDSSCAVVPAGLAVGLGH
jgi:hypothetical protein